MNPIKNFMTEAPHAIGQDQPLKLAHDRMQQFAIRHLPVLDGGVLVGVVSERDVALIGAISKGDSSEVTVEEAMSAEPYAVSPDADVVDVCAAMAEHKYGCAVVMEHNKVSGVFTTTDALHMLSRVLRDAGGAAGVTLGKLADERKRSHAGTKK